MKIAGAKRVCILALAVCLIMPPAFGGQGDHRCLAPNSLFSQMSDEHKSKEILRNLCKRIADRDISPEQIRNFPMPREFYATLIKGGMINIPTIVLADGSKRRPTFGAKQWAGYERAKITVRYAEDIKGWIFRGAPVDSQGSALEELSSDSYINPDAKTLFEKYELGMAGKAQVSRLMQDVLYGRLSEEAIKQYPLPSEFVTDIGVGGYVGFPSVILPDGEKRVPNFKNFLLAGHKRAKITMRYEEAIRGHVLRAVPPDEKDNALDEFTVEVKIESATKQLFEPYELGMNEKQQIREYLQKSLNNELTEEQIKTFPMPREFIVEPGKNGQTHFKQIQLADGRMQRPTFGLTSWREQKRVKITTRYAEDIKGWVFKGVPMDEHNAPIESLAYEARINPKVGNLFEVYELGMNQKQQVTDFAQQLLEGKLSEEDVKNYVLPTDFFVQPRDNGYVHFSQVTVDDKKMRVVFRNTHWIGYDRVRITTRYAEDIKGWVFRGVPYDKDGKALEEFAYEARIHPKASMLFEFYELGIDSQKYISAFIHKLLNENLPWEEIHKYELPQDFDTQPGQRGFVFFPAVTMKDGVRRQIAFGHWRWDGHERIRISVRCDEGIQSWVLRGMPVDKDGKLLEELAFEARITPKAKGLFEAYDLGILEKEKIREFLELLMQGTLSERAIQEYPMPSNFCVQPDALGDVTLPRPALSKDIVKQAKFGSGLWAGKKRVKITSSYSAEAKAWVFRGVPEDAQGKALENLVYEARVNKKRKALFETYELGMDEKELVSAYLQALLDKKMSKEEMKKFPIPRLFYVTPNTGGSILFPVVKDSGNKKRQPYFRVTAWDGQKRVKITTAYDETVGNWVLQGVPVNEQGLELPELARCVRVDTQVKRMLASHDAVANSGLRDVEIDFQRIQQDSHLSEAQRMRLFIGLLIATQRRLGLGAFLKMMEDNGFPKEYAQKIYDESLLSWFAAKASWRCLQGMSDDLGLAMPREVLDIGSGPSVASRAAQVLELEIAFTDVDPSQMMLGYGLNDDQRIVGEMANLPLKNEVFDLVNLAFSLHYVPEEARAQVLSEAHCRVKPYGKIMIVSPQKITAEFLEAVEEMGFKVLARPKPDAWVEVLILESPMALRPILSGKKLHLGDRTTSDGAIAIERTIHSAGADSSEQTAVIDLSELYPDIVDTGTERSQSLRHKARLKKMRQAVEDNATSAEQKLQTLEEGLDNFGEDALEQFEDHESYKQAALDLLSKLLQSGMDAQQLQRVQGKIRAMTGKRQQAGLQRLRLQIEGKNLSAVFADASRRAEFEQELARQGLDWVLRKNKDMVELVPSLTATMEAMLKTVTSPVVRKSKGLPLEMLNRALISMSL